MKSITLVVFVALFVAVSCRPGSLDLQQVKAQAARNLACMRDCTAVKLDPVCASKPGDRPKSFGSVCAMNNHNCQHAETFTVVSKGACAGSDGIRLS